MLTLAVAALSLTLAAEPPPQKVDERTGLERTEAVRLSLPTEEDVQAWASPGLRLQLGFGYAGLSGAPNTFDVGQFAFTLRPEVRVDRHWSIGASFTYGVSLEGLTWRAMLEPSFHPVRQLALTLGAGYGGMTLQDLDNTRSSFETTGNISRTLPQTARLPSCTGTGVAALARAEYLFVAGPLFASGPYLQAQAQWTACEIELGTVAFDLNQTVVLRQWWQQTGLGFGWWLTWR